MKISHNIKLLKDDLTLSGQILKTIFEDGEDREDDDKQYSRDGKFFIASYEHPCLYPDSLFVWGSTEWLDGKTVYRTYSSKEEALKILSYINEFSIEIKQFIFDIELRVGEDLQNHPKIKEVYDFLENNKNYKLELNYEFIDCNVDTIKSKEELTMNLNSVKIRFTANFIKDNKNEQRI